MPHRRLLIWMICLLVLAVVSPVRADPVTLTFEDLPESKLYDGGREIIGAFYPGLVFGPSVFGGNGGNPNYPAHSGDTVIFSATTSMSIDFGPPIMSFSTWYTSVDPLMLSFFDSSNALLGTLTGAPNYPGRSDVLLFTATGISRVTITGADPGLFVLDDLSYAPVPEPVTLLMFSAGLVIVRGVRRRRLTHCAS